MAMRDAGGCWLLWRAVEALLHIQMPFSLMPRDSKPMVPSLVPRVLCPMRREPSCCFKHCLLETLQSRFQSSCRFFPWI